jgi:hypothetical protein
MKKVLQARHEIVKYTQGEVVLTKEVMFLSFDSSLVLTEKNKFYKIQKTK